MAFVIKFNIMQKENGKNEGCRCAWEVASQNQDANLSLCDYIEEVNKSEYVREELIYCGLLSSPKRKC